MAYKVLFEPAYFCVSYINNKTLVLNIYITCFFENKTTLKLLTIIDDRNKKLSLFLSFVCRCVFLIWNFDLETSSFWLLKLNFDLLHVEFQLALCWIHVFWNNQRSSWTIISKHQLTLRLWNQLNGLARRAYADWSQSKCCQAHSSILKAVESALLFGLSLHELQSS